MILKENWIKKCNFWKEKYQAAKIKPYQFDKKCVQKCHYFCFYDFDFLIMSNFSPVMILKLEIYKQNICYKESHKPLWCFLKVKSVSITIETYSFLMYLVLLFYLDPDINRKYNNLCHSIRRWMIHHMNYNNVLQTNHN